MSYRKSAWESDRAMAGKDFIIREIEQLPESCMDEVLDFIRILKSKNAQEKSGTALASEPVLKKDWLDPEEDLAWQNL